MSFDSSSDVDSDDNGDDDTIMDDKTADVVRAEYGRMSRTEQ